MINFNSQDKSFNNLIKNSKERTKTPLYELAKNRNDKEKQLRSTGFPIRIKILLASILLGLSFAKSIKQKSILLLISFILTLTNYNL